MIITVQNGILCIDNKRFCYAKINDHGSQDVRPATRKVSTQYSHVNGRVLPLVADAGWITDDDSGYVRIGSVLGGNGPIKCHMSLSGLVARIEAAEDFGASVLIEIK